MIQPVLKAAPTRLISFLLFTLLFLAESAMAAPTARFTPARTSGVAPLAVFFDGTTTTDSNSGVDAFHDLVYTWSFSDSSSGNWRHSGKSRNRALGPVASHVFDKPGSYQVVLTVRDGSGRSSSTSHTITVQNPDQVFSGTSTLCFSNSSNFSGCPSGAQRVTTSSFSDALDNLGAGKRLLFRRGDDFRASDKTRLEQGPSTIGAFGSGAKPVVTSTLNEPVLEPRPAIDIRVMDIDFRGSWSSGYDRLVKAEKAGSRQLLLYRLGISNFRGNSLLIHHLQIEYVNADRLHDQIFVIDNDIVDNGQNMVFVSAERVAVMGNNVGRGNAHLIRMPFSSPGVVQHNHVFDAAEDRFHALKIHAGDFTPSGGVGNSLTAGRYNDHIVISDNEFYGNSWTVSIGPQSESKSQYDERVKNVIIERNMFRSDGDTRNSVAVHSFVTTVRNNIFDMSSTSGASGMGGVDVDHFGQVTEPTYGVKVYNNSCYTKRSSTSTIRCVNVSGDMRDVTVRNNIIFGPNASRLSVVGSGSQITSSNNQAVTSTPFVSANPRDPADFELRAGSPALDAGFNLVTRLDFFETPRPSSGIDVGAIEGPLQTRVPAAPSLLPQVAAQ